MEQQPQKVEKVEVLKEMPEEWRILREKVLKNFESKTDGMDIERVKDFIKGQGLPVSDFLIVEREDIPKLQVLFMELNSSLSADMEGRYIPELDLTFVRRDYNSEKNNGAIYTEGILVHELTHSVGCSKEYIKKAENVFVPRIGFGFTKESFGLFLEEGFAELMRGEYVDKNLTREEKESIKMAQSKQVSDENGYGMKDKYMFFEDGKLEHSLLSVAGVGLEILCGAIPNLRQTFAEARGDLEKLREIPKLINGIKPGLYMEIQKCEPTPSGLIKTYNLIKEAVQNSK